MAQRRPPRKRRWFPGRCLFLNLRIRTLLLRLTLANRLLALQNRYLRFQLRVLTAEDAILSRQPPQLDQKFLRCLPLWLQVRLLALQMLAKENVNP